MRNLTHMGALVLTMMAGAGFSAGDQGFAPGLTELVIADESRPLMGVIWYPAPNGASVTRVQSNPVWEGVDAAVGVDMVEGRFPLVVLSHGMYGNHRNQNWLAEALARKGYVVVAIDHPGTSTFLRDPEQARQLWERPRDISRTIDHMLNASDMTDRIDPDRIYMAGHSLGGWTAMMLAGGRFDAARFEAHCEGGARNVACGVLERWQVAQSEEDRKIIARDYSDARIKAFAVLDLGGTQTFDPASLGAITTPAVVIGAPLAGSDIELDVESRALVAEMTAADVSYLEPEGTSHFDLMGVCTDRGLAILKEEEPEDAVVCVGGTDARRVKHAMFIDAIVARFSE